MEKQYPDGALLEIQDKLDDVYDQKEGLSKKEFLNRFPEKYIGQKGDIFDVKKGMEKYFQKNKRGLGKEVSEQLNKTLKDVKFVFDDKNSEDLCKLKIKLSQDKIYFIEIPGSSTLRDLYSKLEEKIKKNFILETSYPRQKLDKNIDIHNLATFERIN